MNPGDLRHRLTIQSKTETADGIGGFSEAWGTFANVWGAVWPTSAKELVQNQQLQGQVTHRVRIRYLAGVTTSMRILLGARVLNILSIVNPNEAGELLDLVCLEEV